MHRTILSASLLAALALAGCDERDAASADQAPASDAAAAAQDALTDWPHVDSAIAADPAIEVRVREIVAGMTLAQKVGQMTQAEIKSVTPEQVREYYLGSVLNGGGSWPGQDKPATTADWVALADSLYDASLSTDLPVPVPVTWGTAAWPGHGHVIRP